MKQLLTITISILAMTLAGCNFYTDIDADWNGEEGESSECDDLLVMLEAEDDEQRRAEIAAEYSRCAGVDPDDRDDETCEDGREGEECHDDGHQDPDDEVCPDGSVCDIDRIDCQQVEVWVSGHTPEEALHFCSDIGLSAAQCRSVLDRCVGEDWNPGDDGGNPGGNGLCEYAYQTLMDNNIDPQSLNSDEAFELCMQMAMDQTANGDVDESVCQEVADQCFADDGGNSNTNTCSDLIDQASSVGAQEPQTQEEADALHDQCLQAVADTQICDELIRCYGFTP